MTDTTAASAKPKKFYDRLKAATQHRFAEPILAALCFLEAMILPIFPEIMLAPMIIADRRRAWRLATICTVASVTGGLVGYAIGYFLFDTIGRAIIRSSWSVSSWRLKLIRPSHSQPEVEVSKSCSVMLPTLGSAFAGMSFGISSPSV